MNKEEINEIIKSYIETNNGIAIIELMFTFDPMGDPRKITAKGILVPLGYAVYWNKRYGCNNWRKLNKIPMKRKQRKFNNR